jgi:hypothetical protein
VEQKEKLKGDGLFAQTLYSMEAMLRLFAQDSTGTELKSPEESWGWNKGRFYGAGVVDDELRHLEFLTTTYHLNPRPRLILVIEGNGEEQQIPRLVEEMFGCPLSRFGIELYNITGIGNFVGVKRLDRFGALEKFIDAYHIRQTVVFVLLDNEGGASKVVEQLKKAISTRYPMRKLTRPEYIHLWARSIEFDNFSNDEIAAALTRVSEGRYQFSATEVQQSCSVRDGNPLGRLYEAKLTYGLEKATLLRVLFDPIMAKIETNKGRPIFKILGEVVKIANLNHQPVRLEDWQVNQESGYLGDKIT